MGVTHREELATEGDDTPCPYPMLSVASLSDIHGRLRCSATHGCPDCVPCSEDALAVLRSHIILTKEEA